MEVDNLFSSVLPFFEVHSEWLLLRKSTTVLSEEDYTLWLTDSNLSISSREEPKNIITLKLPGSSRCQT